MATAVGQVAVATAAAAAAGSLRRDSISANATKVSTPAVRTQGSGRSPDQSRAFHE